MSVDDFNNRINNIKFILGNKASYCLPGNDIVFGKNNNINSIFTNTDIGVILNGDLNSYINNIDFYLNVRIK